MIIYQNSVLKELNKWVPSAPKGAFGFVELKSNGESIFTYHQVYNVRSDQIREGMEVRVFDLREPHLKGQRRYAERVEVL